MYPVKPVPLPTCASGLCTGMGHRSVHKNAKNAKAVLRTSTDEVRAFGNGDRSGRRLVPGPSLGGGISLFIVWLAEGTFTRILLMLCAATAFGGT
jgi:hypothetical protein